MHSTLWRNGLILKLYKLGIGGKTFSLINKCYCNTASSVIINQTQSRWFSVQQGVWQGGILSTFLYLVQVNDLINDLQMHISNTGILNVRSSCPSLADDISCIALSPAALQNLLDTACRYSNTWRFKFNASNFPRQGQQAKRRCSVAFGSVRDYQ
jgi:hypothetical protein